MVLVTFLCVHPKTSFVSLDGRYKRSSQRVFQSETPLTTTAALERIRPVGVTDDVFRELRASLDLGPQQVALVEEQDERGIRQQFVRDD